MTQITLPNTNITGANLWSQVEDNDQAIADVVNGDIGADNLTATAVSLPRCYATRFQTLEIPNNQLTTIALPTEERDTHSFHSTSSNTSRITIPAGLDGDYQLIGSIEFAGASSTALREVRFRKNGTNFSDGIQQEWPDSGDLLRLTTSHIALDLVAGDYIEIAVAQLTGSPLNLNRATLYVQRVG